MDESKDTKDIFNFLHELVYVLSQEKITMILWTEKNLYFEFTVSYSLQIYPGPVSLKGILYV